MTKVTVFVGLDYHQDSVQVCVMDRDGSVLTNRRCANAWEAIRAVVPRRGPIGPAETHLHSAHAGTSWKGTVPFSLCDNRGSPRPATQPGLTTADRNVGVPDSNCTRSSW